MEKIKITNPCQFEKLVEELERNPSLARGFRRGTTPSNFKEQWERIGTVLNSLGPPSRTGDGWQKIWRDLKFKVKKKMTINKVESKATGGGVFKQIALGPLDEAVANLLQFDKQINPEGMVQGVPSTEGSVTFCSLESLEMDNEPTSNRTIVTTSTSIPSAPSAALSPIASTSAPPTSAISTNGKQTPLKNKISSTPKKNEPPAKRNKLLEKHSIDQARILTEISNSMLSMKRNLRDMKEIESKRLQIEIERNKREEEMHVAEMKIKTIELSIREKELQLLNGNEALCSTQELETTK